MVTSNKSGSFARKHMFVFSVALAVLVLAIQLLLGKVLILGSEHPETRLYGIADIVTMLVPTILVCAAAILIGMKDKLAFSKKNFGKGLLLGLPLVVLGVYAGVSTLTEVGFSNLSYPGIVRIATFVLSMLLIGVLEEFLCRGIILNLMLEKWGHTRGGIRKAVLLSSFIFGVTHLANLLVYPNSILSTIAQVFYSSFIGIYFACIYMRCKNLYAVAILHAFWNACMLLINILYLPAALETLSPPVDAGVLDALVSTVIFLPFALLGFFLIRKKKLPLAEGVEIVA